MALQVGDACQKQSAIVWRSASRIGKGADDIVITNDQHARKGVVHDKVDVGNHPNENGNQVICTDEQMYTKSQTHHRIGWTDWWCHTAYHNGFDRELRATSGRRRG